MPDTAFNYLTAEKSPLYMAIMGAFSEAKSHFIVHLRPEDIVERIEPNSGLEAIQNALEQLVHWGNLQAEPDTSRVTTVEDFYRARYLYQITRKGEAAEAALATYRQVLDHGGALQAVALQDIRTQLQALRQLAAQSQPDPARVHLCLRDLSQVFADLADNARAFMSGLARALEQRGVEREAFLAFKERLIDYLERFIGDLVNASGEIAGLIEALEKTGLEPLFLLVAEREADDSAPLLDPQHPARDEQRPERVARAQQQWRAHWAGLRSWFLGGRGHPSQSSLLRSRARKAISQLLEMVMLLNERRLGRSDRTRDFRTLARWFMECPDDADAHRLWRAAFGLTPARHLGIDAETQAQREEQAVAASVSWLEAPPLQISPRLRATGSFQRRGGAAKVRNRSGERRKLAGLLAAESAQTRSARQRLANGRAMRLSELGVLKREEFGLFLQLLGEVLATSRGDEQTLHTITGDGGLSLELTPLDAAAQARIETPDGHFCGRDHLLRITDVEQEKR